MKKVFPILIAVILLLTTLGAGVSCSSGTTQETTQSQTAEEFYKTHPLTVVVPLAPGGGGDFAGRIFAAHWFDVTGGTAQVVNMPGGASMVGINYVWNAKADGLTIGTAPDFANITGLHIAKTEGMQFKMDEFGWIGWFAPEPTVVCISSAKPYKTMADLQAVKGLRCGSSGLAIQTSHATAIYTMDLDAKIVTGYGSGAETSLANGRGELDFMATATAAAKSYVDQGFLKSPFVVIGDKPSVLYPDVPLIKDLVKNWNPDKEKFFQIQKSLRGGKPFYVTPGIPADRLEYLRRAFDKMMELPGFKAMGELRYGKMDPPAKGEEVQAIAKQVMGYSEADMNWFNGILESYVLVK